MSNTNIDREFLEIIKKMDGARIYGEHINMPILDYSEKALVVAAYWLGRNEELQNRLNQQKKLLGE